MDAIGSARRAGRSFVRTTTLIGSGSLTSSIRVGPMASRNALNGVVRSDGSGVVQYASANFTSAGNVIVRQALRPRAYDVQPRISACDACMATAAYLLSATDVMSTSAFGRSGALTS